MVSVSEPESKDVMLAAKRVEPPLKRVEPWPSRWELYILRCGDNSLYIGTTTDLTRRLEEHASGKGGAYTRTRLPVTLLYREPHVDRAAAQRREERLKRWTKRKKLVLISSNLDLLKKA